jgi:stage IV sporulation protein FB
MFIGGAAQMDRIPTKPLAEFLMAIAGPAVSLVLGVLCLWGGRFVSFPAFLLDFNIIEWVGVVNLGLLFFNLLPAFPMDGGRVLRSALTPKMGRLKATLIAARLGKAMAVLFGVYGFLTHQWMLVVIAFFVFISAGNEYHFVQMQEAARRSAFGGWPSFDTGRRSSADADDKVVISPPPYEDGPDQETEIRPADDDNPFKNIFRR